MRDQTTCSFYGGIMKVIFSSHIFTLLKPKIDEFLDVDRETNLFLKRSLIYFGALP
jgi:hypothetical protein